jgi:hypothetical protein
MGIQRVREELKIANLTKTLRDAQPKDPPEGQSSNHRNSAYAVPWPAQPRILARSMAVSYRIRAYVRVCLCLCVLVCVRTRVLGGVIKIMRVVSAHARCRWLRAGAGMRACGLVASQSPPIRPMSLFGACGTCPHSAVTSACAVRLFVHRQPAPGC